MDPISAETTKVSPIMVCAFSPKDFFSVLSMRSGLVQSPIREKKTGFPWNDAASTRSGRVVSGQTPVQAIRVSVALSELQAGCVGWNLEGSSPASLNRTFQSNGVAAAVAEAPVDSLAVSSFCAGIA